MSEFGFRWSQWWQCWESYPAWSFWKNGELLEPTKCDPWDIPWRKWSTELDWEGFWQQWGCMEQSRVCKLLRTPTTLPWLHFQPAIIIFFIHAFHEFRNNVKKTKSLNQKQIEKWWFLGHSGSLTLGVNTANIWKFFEKQREKQQIEALPHREIQCLTRTSSICM